jgi:hypothetical protein
MKVAKEWGGGSWNIYVCSRIIGRVKCVLTACVSVGMNGTAMPRLPTSTLVSPVEMAVGRHHHFGATSCLHILTCRRMSQLRPESWHLSNHNFTSFSCIFISAFLCYIRMDEIRCVYVLKK